MKKNGQSFSWLWRGSEFLSSVIFHTYTEKALKEFWYWNKFVPLAWNLTLGLSHSAGWQNQIVTEDADKRQEAKCASQFAWSLHPLLKTWSGNFRIQLQGSSSALIAQEEFQAIKAGYKRTSTKPLQGLSEALLFNHCSFHGAAGEQHKSLISKRQVNTASVDLFCLTARWSITQAARLIHQHQTNAGIKFLKPCFYGLYLRSNRSCKGHFLACSCVVIKSNTNCLTISTTRKALNCDWQIFKSAGQNMLNCKPEGGESTQKFSMNRKSISNKNYKPFLWSLMRITTLGHLEVNLSKLLEGRMKI